MKESAWRTKLIRIWRRRKTRGFIWAHDAKFKAGFPDLYAIDNGVSRHYELKVSHSNYIPGYEECEKLFKPIQLEIMRQIITSGGVALGMVLLHDKNVAVINPSTRAVRYYNGHEFDRQWDNFSI